MRGDSVFGDDDDDEDIDSSIQSGTVLDKSRPGHEAHAADGNGSRQQHSTRVSSSSSSGCNRGSSDGSGLGDSHNMQQGTVPLGSRSSNVQLHASSGSSLYLKGAAPAAAAV